MGDVAVAVNSYELYSNGMKRLGVVAILVLSFGGIADSAYLAQHKLFGTPLLCNVQNLSDCNTVAASPYSQIFGIPLAGFGVLFYSLLFILAALELVLFSRLLRRVLQIFAVIGVLFSLYFIVLQMFVINAFCIYCLASALIALLILVFASYIEPVQGSTKSASVPSPQPPHLTMPPAL